MNFQLTREQELVKQMVREFAINEVKPLAAEIDETEQFPMENVKKMILFLLKLEMILLHGNVSKNHQKIFYGTLAIIQMMLEAILKFMAKDLLCIFHLIKNTIATHGIHYFCQTV